MIGQIYHLCPGLCQGGFIVVGGIVDANDINLGLICLISIIAIQCFFLLFLLDFDFVFLLS